MRATKSLIIFKKSKFEYDKERLHLTTDQLLKRYHDEGVDPRAILESHQHQASVRTWFEDIYGDHNMVSLSEVMAVANYPGLELTKADFYLVVGGDNSFTLASHVVKGPIVGINSDPDRSTGHLLSYSVRSHQDVEKLTDILDGGKYQQEAWARLQCTVDYVPFSQATSEYFVGEYRRTQMSRHILEHNGQRVEQKCSGLLVATGVGSTGWIASGRPGLRGAAIRRTEQMAIYGATESYKGSHDMGVLHAGEELIVHSLNDDRGIVSADSWRECGFKRGQTARIKLGTPLEVVIPHENV